MFHEKLPINAPWKMIKLKKSMKGIWKEIVKAFKLLF